MQKLLDIPFGAALIGTGTALRLREGSQVHPDLKHQLVRERILHAKAFSDDRPVTVDT